MVPSSEREDQQLLVASQGAGFLDQGSVTSPAIAPRMIGFYRKHPLVTSSVLGIVLVMLYIGLRNGVGVADKTVWDWLDILVLPMVLAVGAIGYESIERKRDEQRAEDQRERELQIINEQAQAVALQTYLDQMSNLMIDRKLRATDPDSDERGLAQARTLTILLALGSDRKRHPLKLVAQLHLIDKGNPIIKLPHADLNEANLAEVTLIKVDLTDVDLRAANLTDANLRGTVLADADLRGANLTGANLTGANLTGANLTGANLTGARVTHEQLAASVSLSQATMPDGSIND
jgi:hypothetical protein